MHDDAPGGKVDGGEPGANEGDEDGLVVGCGEELDSEERSGVGEAGAAIGAGGELEVDDGADGEVGVVEGAAEEVADEEGVGVEGWEGGGGDEELLAGDGLGGGDGVAAGELQDDTASVLTGGKEVGFEGDGGGVWGRGIGLGESE